MNSSKELISKLNEQIAHIADVKRLAVEDLKKDFEKLVENVLRENNFPYITMCGYRPSFNDGDPCTFTFSCNDHVDDLAEHFKDIDLPNFELYDYGTISEEDDASRRKIEKDFCKLETLLEDAFGSDGWQVLAVIDAQGNFHYHFNDEYDCGY